MKYPVLIIDKQKVKHNTEILTKQCAAFGIDVAAVTKVFCGIPEVAEVMIEGGAKLIADSRIENLKKMAHLPLPKMLLRLPMISIADDVVKYADISLNSEIEVIKALSEASKKADKVHKIVLMTDLGDLREGIWYEKLLASIPQILELSAKKEDNCGIKLVGIGTNLTRYGGVIPDENNLVTLLNLAKEIETRFNIKLEIISGGNSSSLHLVFKGEIPTGINQLRLGESIVLGLETAYGERIENTYRDAFTFAAEIIELKEKPSAPIGQIGMDAFGQKPVFEDKGTRLRGILAAGRQDVLVSGLTPHNEGLSIIGASSDHLIVDFTDCAKKYKVGDIVKFDVNYGCLLAAATSEYVNKIVI